MTFEFDIPKIVAYLTRYKNQLPHLYKWNPKLDRLVAMKVLTSCQVNELNQLSPFERELKLKSLIGKELNAARGNNDPLFKDLCLWIIKDWGGILNGSQNVIFYYVNDFLSRKNPKFYRISSTSKVCAYLYPDKNVIYDSRVVYSLNWIILSQTAGRFYFPIPESRNSRLTAFDISVLIRLKNIINYQPSGIKKFHDRQFIKYCDSCLFIPEKIAYTEFCKVISLVHKELWGNEKAGELYYTEMLLFAIADKEIFQDMIRSLSLKIANLN